MSALLCIEYQSEAPPGEVGVGASGAGTLLCRLKAAGVPSGLSKELCWGPFAGGGGLFLLIITDWTPFGRLCLQCSAHQGSGSPTSPSVLPRIVNDGFGNEGPFAGDGMRILQNYLAFTDVPNYWLLAILLLPGILISVEGQGSRSRHEQA